MNFITSLKKASFPLSGGRHEGQGKARVNRRGEQQEQGFNQYYGNSYTTPWHAGHSYNISCQWEPFREQILAQWDRLTGHEVDEVGPNRSKLAMLIENKYGIASHLVENYLRNFERTLPLI